MKYFFQEQKDILEEAKLEQQEYLLEVTEENREELAEIKQDYRDKRELQLEEGQEKIEETKELLDSTLEEIAGQYEFDESKVEILENKAEKASLEAIKKQAKEIVSECAKRVNMPYATERWLGGMLTNFSTIRKSVKKMLSIEKMLNDGTLDSVTKKERLTLTRSKEKMEKVLGGISQMGRVPAAIFMVDISHEHIALAEAKRLGITTIAMVDTNSDPTKVDFAIPSNDDATKSIAIITQYLTAAILEGLQERAQVKEEDDNNEEETENRGRGMELTEEDGEGGRRGGRGRGRSAGAGAGVAAGVGAGAAGITGSTSEQSFRFRSTLSISVTVPLTTTSLPEGKFPKYDTTGPDNGQVTALKSLARIFRLFPDICVMRPLTVSVLPLYFSVAATAFRP